MAGGSQRHNIISVNLTTALNAHLPDRCVAYMADMKVRIRLERAEFFYYTDSMVCSGPADQSLDWRDNPLVLAEVLSPSTISFDRFRKLEEYKTVAEIEVILMIDTEAAQVTIHRRRQRLWEAETVEGLDAVISFEGVIEAELADDVEQQRDVLRA